ncbi:MAG: rhomboid family intramembrane serine protease [Anaerolineales bacterium]
MLPLRDTIRSRTFPLVNWAIILANLGIFFYEASLGPRGVERLFSTFALVPSEVTGLQPAGLITLVTSMFLHGGWFHVISNMWTLYIFGDNVEDRMGSSRYLAFYLLGGIVAGLTHVYFSPSTSAPTVGASGAIAAVLGAYFILFPASRVITLVPLFFLPWLMEVPAVVFLGVWFLTQVLSGLVTIGAAGEFSNIAWWAHIGGFAFGFLMVHVFARRARAYARWHRDEYWPY